MSDQLGFEMWFTIHQDRIRNLRDKYEKENNTFVKLDDFAHWLYLDEENHHQLILN